MRKKLIFVLLIILAVIVCYPIVFLLSGSVMSMGELKNALLPMMTEGSENFVAWRIIPMYPTLKYYVELLLDTPEFFTMFWNSVKLTFCILVIQLGVGIPAAWGFARYEFPCKKLLFTVYIVLMMMPFQVTMLSSYLVLDRFHLMDTHLAVILPAGFSTFPVFIMYRFFKGIPKAIMEAAQIDGANAVQNYIYIGLPLGSAGIISAMVLGFLEYWNLIEQPLTFLNTQTLWPLSLYLPEISLENAGIAFVSSVVTLVPAVLVFLSGQDYLEQGIVAAAVKE